MHQILLGPDKERLFSLAVTCDAEKTVVDVLHASLTANACVEEQQAVGFAKVQGKELGSQQYSSCIRTTGCSNQALLARSHYAR